MGTNVHIFGGLNSPLPDKQSNHLFQKSAIFTSILLLIMNQMYLRINPMCGYSQRSTHTHTMSGSFTNELTRLKPSNICCFCFCVCGGSFHWHPPDDTAAEHSRCKASHGKGRLFSLGVLGLRLHVCVWVVYNCCSSFAACEASGRTLPLWDQS